MPRRTLPTPRDTKGVVDRIKYWLADARTWTSFVYLLLMLPLGVAYFSTAVAIGATSLALAGSPILLLLAHNDTGVDIEAWNWIVAVLLVPAGILGAVGLLHLARAIGGLHGRFAKAMLVGGEGRANRRDPVSIPGSLGRAAVFVGITAIAGAVGLGASSAYVHSQSKRITQEATAERVSTLRLDETDADIAFVVDSSLDDGELRVEARGRVQEDDDDARIVQLDVTDRIATLSSVCSDDLTLFAFGCDIDMTVFVPANASFALRGQNATGDLEFRGVTFETIDVDSDTGDVEGRVGAEQMRVHSDTGDVELDVLDPTRLLDVETDTGDVELMITGAWRIETSTDTGDREVAPSDFDADRSLRVRSDTGDIEVRRTGEDD